MDKPTAKTCSRCGEIKPLTDYYVRKGKAQAACKACIIAGNKRWNDAHPEAIAAASTRWQRRNKDRVRAHNVEWYHANKQSSRDRVAAWKLANPEADSLRRIKGHQRRRARVLLARVGPVDLNLLWIRQCAICAICNARIDRGLAHPDPMSKSLDHIVPLALGGTHEQSNLAWTHLVCNLRKGTRLAA